MKNPILFIIAMAGSISLSAQIFPQDLETTWKFQDETEKIIEISFDLPDFEDLRYLKIVIRAYVDDRLIPMKSVRGDIGEAVKVGKNKTILWDWENDVVEIAGNLKFEVTADNPNPGTTESKPDNRMIEPQVPVMVVLGLPALAGGGLAITGLLSSSGAKSDWDGLSAAEKTTGEYDDLNGKYKNGQYLAIAGGAIIVAGVIWYLKEKSAISNLQSSRISINSGSDNLASTYFKLPTSTIGLSLAYNF